MEAKENMCGFKGENHHLSKSDPPCLSWKTETQTVWLLRIDASPTNMHETHQIQPLTNVLIQIHDGSEEDG